MTKLITIIVIFVYLCIGFIVFGFLNARETKSSANMFEIGAAVLFWVFVLAILLVAFIYDKCIKIGEHLNDAFLKDEGE